MTTKFFARLSNDLTQLLEDPIDYNVSIEVETPFNDDHVKALTISDISVKIFNIIIKYIYGGIILLEKLEISFIFDLLITSNELELDELVEHLQTHLVNNNASWLRLNFVQVYKTSYQVKNLKIIQDVCNDIIAKHPNTIFESDDFHSIPESALNAILIRDDLQLEESKVWEYVIQWGKAKNPTLPTNLAEWTSENFITLKNTLKKCLPHVRYFNISNIDVLDKLFPYQQIFEPKLWLDINTKFIAPDRQISSTILPPRKIFTKTFLTQIITDEYALEISSWIDKQEIPYTENDPYEFELLIKGSRDGFDVKTIYRICDKVSNTVIILKVEGTGEILGGYNPLEWDKNYHGWKTAQDSFSFSLKTANLKNSILSRVKNVTCGIWNSSEFFSFGFSLILKNNLKTSKKCYCGDNEWYEKPIRPAEFLSSGFNPTSSDKSTFNVEEYEIFKVSKRDD